MDLASDKALIAGGLSSGKHTKNYGKSPFLMGKLTISTGPCSIAMLNYQRVSHFIPIMVGYMFIWGFPKMGKFPSSLDGLE